MAGQESNKKSKKSKRTMKKTKAAKTGGFQKMDQDSPGMDKVPSNAPTMAIAPSDYEHIFHEGNTTTATTLNGERPSPPAQMQQQQQQQPTFQQQRPQAHQFTQQAPPLPPTPAQVIAARTYPPQPMNLPMPAYSPPRPSRSPGQQQQLQQQLQQDDFAQPPQTQQYSYGAEVPVTPDGYTYLGQPTLEAGNNRNRIALPPHIVRASNQFSRAALSRVARYLASRADPSFMH